MSSLPRLPESQQARCQSKEGGMCVPLRQSCLGQCGGDEEKYYNPRIPRSGPRIDGNATSHRIIGSITERQARAAEKGPDFQMEARQRLTETYGRRPVALPTFPSRRRW